MKYFLACKLLLRLLACQRNDQRSLYLMACYSAIAASVFTGGADFAHAQTAPAATTELAPITVTGTVPDQATKARLISRLKEVYSDKRVVDQLTVGNAIAPPNWSASVEKILNEKLKTITQGQLSVDGNTVQLRGQIANEALRQQMVGGMAAALTSSYVIKDGLTVMTSEQTVLDNTLRNRTIEFDSGSANLRNSGRQVLDEMATVILQLPNKKIEVVGHTDDRGYPNNNLILSRARAESVKSYLVSKGIAASSITTSGMGANQPLVSNETEEGRNRNRRIEFRIAN